MLDSLLSLVFVTGSVLGILIASCYVWAWYYHVSTSQDETGYFRTADGWRLAVHRYRPRGNSAGYPVILCHGLGGNRYSFDLRGAPSLAPYLRNRGWDVWVVELRGSGASDRPGVWFSDVPYKWGFEDHLSYDVPAVIDYVLDRTGASAAHWIGHSMGGMLIEAYLAGQSSPKLATATAIGSPADFSKIDRPFFDALLHVKWMLRVLPFAPMPYIGKMFIPVIHRLPTSVQSLFYPPNIEPRRARTIVAIGSPMVMSNQLWLDFGRFLESDGPTTESGEAYLERLWESDVPILLIGGSKDVMAPPAAVAGAARPGKDIGERLCITVGQAFGCREEYGHVDLLVGSRADTEVYPHILEWLVRHDSLSNRRGEGDGPSPPLGRKAEAGSYGTGTGIANGPGIG